jgi:hypothetical protein
VKRLSYPMEKKLFLERVGRGLKCLRRVPRKSAIRARVQIVGHMS